MSHFNLPSDVPVGKYFFVWVDNNELYHAPHANLIVINHLQVAGPIGSSAHRRGELATAK